MSSSSTPDDPPAAGAEPHGKPRSKRGDLDAARDGREDCRPEDCGPEDRLDRPPGSGDIGVSEGETRGFDDDALPASEGSEGFDSEVALEEPQHESGGDMPLRVGEYRIQKLIGSGGMGRVYLARHEPMQRTVALKTLPPERMRQASAVERFYGEVRAAGRLLHPNIVTAFDAGTASGIHYLAMEYVDGPTLAMLVAQGGPMSIGAAVSAIRDAARGLAHAHAAGIVHRDVKPSNLMRARDGTVKIVDLGLASVGIAAAGERKQRDAGRLVGTIAFMSPEQLENPDAVDARSDIYSLGATFYFLLTGRPPYGGEFLDQVRGHRHDPLPELFAIRPDADLRLEHVLHRMMAKRPHDRYGSLAEVIADLAIHDVNTSVPNWIAGFAAKQAPGDSSTLHSLSTHGEIPKVMAIDLGMFYASAAIANPSGDVQLLLAGGDGKSQFRLALADGQPLVFGDTAATQRQQRPGSVMHCAPLFIAQTRMEHMIAGRRCPAEVLLALQLRHLVHTCWTERSAPQAVAITVPSCYDQLHRQAILQAAAIAGIRSVRLVDRSLAALQSWHLDLAQHSAGPAASERIDRDAPLLSADDASRPQVIISISGNATEVVITRRRGPRAQQLATTGQWHYGVLQWQQKLVDLAAAMCREHHGFDPLQSLSAASSLQLACERAMTRFLLSESAVISLPRGTGQLDITLDRGVWLDACQPLMSELTEMISVALDSAEIDASRIRHVLLFGLPTRIAANRSQIMKKFSSGAEVITIDRTDIARGAAACIAGELPGRGDIPLPPQPSTCHSLGLLVIDHKGRRRIRTMIPRGTAIPARTSRRIASSKTTHQHLTLVESSTWQETSWRSLGAHRLTTDPEHTNLELTFEVDMDGQLIIRRRDPLSGTIEPLPPRPQPTLEQEELNQWAEWVAELLPAPKKHSPPKT